MQPAMEDKALDRPGAVRLVPASRRGQTCAELSAQRLFVVRADGATPPVGGLRRAIDDAVESALALRGALPPTVDVESDAARQVADQLFRARALGASGFGIALPRLAPLTRGDGMLGADDEDVLSTWVAAAGEAPVVLLVDEDDRGVRLRLPVALEQLVTSPKPPVRARPRAPAMAEGEPPALAVFDPTPVLAIPEPAPVAARDLAPMAAHVRAPVASRRPAPVAQRELPRREPHAIETVADPSGASDPADAIAELVRAIGEDPAAAASGPADARRDAGHVADARREAPHLPPAVDAPGIAVPILEELDGGETELVGQSVERAPHNGAKPARRGERTDAAVLERKAERIVSAAECRSFAEELDAERGPRPVAVIERVFTTRYVPLLGAAMRGEADGAVRAVVDAWRASFERSFREAFGTIRVTGKRPPMVLDAPDVAARIARLNGARATRLLLVDGLRFDLGERVNARLKQRIGDAAVCVERPLLWSALPTTTPVQIALLARGAEGLRDPPPPAEDGETDLLRARGVGTLRRERLGSRELLKLDLVEVRTAIGGCAYDLRFEALADEVSAIVARHVESLPPRTLLFLFGDHGFRMGASPDFRSTGPATQGGASPEEVLVPAYAWLVGGVH